MIKLFFVGGSGELGWSAYAEALTNPNYVDAMIATSVPSSHAPASSGS